MIYNFCKDDMLSRYDDYTNNFLDTIKDDIFFKKNGNYLKILNSQNCVESQRILYTFFKSDLRWNNKCLYDLLYYSDCPIMQRKILRYYKFPILIKNEIMLKYMMNIENESIESDLLDKINSGLIKNINELDYYNRLNEKKMVKRMVKSLWKK